MTPHKHAAVIKAWADGAEIQVRDTGRDYWEDCKNTHKATPLFGGSDLEFRIKPKVVRYRLALIQGGRGYWINAATDRDHEDTIEQSSAFVKWLGSWQEVEI